MNTIFELTNPLPYGLDETSREADFWPTPRPAIESLLSICPPPKGTVLEPAAGDGAIVRVLIDHGYRVVAIDIRRETAKCAPEFTQWIIGDWLKLAKDNRSTSLAIITNPPFSIAQEFTKACLSTGARYIALLLRLNVLGSAPWANLWIEYPPTGIYPLKKRPSFSGDGKTDACNYGWIVWETNKPAINLQPV